jgi:hypothetical protein
MPADAGNVGDRVCLFRVNGMPWYGKIRIVLCAGLAGWLAS